MADETIALTAVRGGLNRLRQKGSPPSDSLYDLLNGYVTAARTVRVRPGTFVAMALPEGTKGLTSANGQLNVFTTDPDVAGQLEVTGATVAVFAHLIQHPAQMDDSGNSFELSDVHFAEKFMGFLYVAATFDYTPDASFGDTYHYWLQTGDVWVADHAYSLGDIVSPSIFQGFYFQATRFTAPNPVWAPGVPREIGDVIEPTIPNGFFYTVVQTFGDNPVSGNIEPNWPAADGAQIAEDTESTFDGLVDAAPQTDPDAAPAPTTQDRYS